MDYSSLTPDLRLREQFIPEWLGLDRAKLYWENELKVILACIPYLQDAAPRVQDTQEKVKMYAYPWTFYEKFGKDGHTGVATKIQEDRDAAVEQYKKLVEAGVL